MDKLLEKVGEGPRFKATIMEALPKEHMHCQVQTVEFVELYVHRRLFYQDAQFIEILSDVPAVTSGFFQGIRQAQSGFNES